MKLHIEISPEVIEYPPSLLNPRCARMDSGWNPRRRAGLSRPKSRYTSASLCPPCRLCTWTSTHSTFHIYSDKLQPVLQISQKLLKFTQLSQGSQSLTSRIQTGLGWGTLQTLVQKRFWDLDFLNFPNFHLSENFRNGKWECHFLSSSAQC